MLQTFSIYISIHNLVRLRYYPSIADACRFLLSRSLLKVSDFVVLVTWHPFSLLTTLKQNKRRLQPAHLGFGFMIYVIMLQRLTWPCINVAFTSSAAIESTALDMRTCSWDVPSIAFSVCLVCAGAPWGDIL
jgi:hypothetical protein